MSTVSVFQKMGCRYKLETTYFFQIQNCKSADAPDGALDGLFQGEKNGNWLLGLVFIHLVKILS